MYNVYHQILIFLVLTGISDVWEASLLLNLLTSLTISVSDTKLKAKLGWYIPSIFFVQRMLAQFSYFFFTVDTVSRKQAISDLVKVFHCQQPK